MTIFRTGVVAIMAGLGISAVSVPAMAQSPIEFFKGKQLAMTMGTRPGGSFQVYTQALAAHMPKHIPGNPTIVPNFIPGAGGTKAANWIYSVAAQDGSQILMSHALPLAQRLRPKGLKFKSEKFQWLGAFSAINQLVTLWKTAPAKTLAELKSKEVIMGSFAKNHLTYQWLHLANNVVGTKMKVVTGFRGGAKNNLAMQQGETHGWAASWGNLNATKPHWLKDGSINILINFGLERIPEIGNVPTLLELAKGDDKAVVDFVASATPVSRALTVGPGVPADRVAVLRTAMEKTLKDPAFLADAKKRKLPLRPRSWQEVTALVKKIVDAPESLVDRVKKMTGQ
jgi:tripartite-type tricarboxylate transporter receptor subunit TctC